MRELIRISNFVLSTCCLPGPQVGLGDKIIRTLFCSLTSNQFGMTAKSIDHINILGSQSSTRGLPHGQMVPFEGLGSGETFAKQYYLEQKVNARCQTRVRKLMQNPFVIFISFPIH